jgi:hypothetical protein
MSRAIRVTVRGMFDGLSPQQLAELVAEQDQHTLMTTAYTVEGYLSYDLPGRPGFVFRFAEQVEEAAEIAGARARAERKALAWMAQRGYAVKNVAVQSVDMSEVPLGKRGRKEAAKKP